VKYHSRMDSQIVVLVDHSSILKWNIFVYHLNLDVIINNFLITEFITDHRFLDHPFRYYANSLFLEKYIPTKKKKDVNSQENQHHKDNIQQNHYDYSPPIGY
jgi:hypothetical protein